jgi:hypothetical protein
MKPHTLEVALRIKSHQGVLLTEHIIRGSQVELINYFPSGKISEREEVSLQDFAEVVANLRSERWLGMKE